MDTSVLVEVDVSCGLVPARFAGDHSSVRSEVVHLAVPDPVTVCQQFTDFIHLALGLMGVVGFSARFEVPSFSGIYTAFKVFREKYILPLCDHADQYGCDNKSQYRCHDKRNLFHSNYPHVKFSLFTQIKSISHASAGRIISVGIMMFALSRAEPPTAIAIKANMVIALTMIFMFLLSGALPPSAPHVYQLLKQMQFGLFTNKSTSQDSEENTLLSMC